MVLSDVDIRRYLALGKIKISPELPPEQFGSCSLLLEDWKSTVLPLN